MATTSQLFLIALMAFFTNSDDKWYENVSMKINDPFNLIPFHAVTDDTDSRILGVIPKVGYKSVTQHQIYAILTREELAKIETPDDKKHEGGVYVSHRMKITKDNVEFWKSKFKREASNVAAPKVPFMVNLGTQVGWKEIPRRLNVAIGLGLLLLEEMLKNDSEKVYKAYELASLIADGGEFYDVWFVERDKEGRPYLHSNVFYSVKVGDEIRHINVFSCRYAIKQTD